MRRPRIGFLGVGWIGRQRMEAMLQTGLIEAAGIADPSTAMAQEAGRLAPEARQVGDLDALLTLGLDAIAIATPSALHADQAIRALRAGVAVFCQKPLGRTEAEVRAVVDAARAADRLLCVDFSYRFTAGMERIRELVRLGKLGRIHAADMIFHNAYGPDKAWFYEAASSGGGCVMDLGVHLIDLGLWLLDFPRVVRVDSQLFSGGERLHRPRDRVEDHAFATIELETGAAIRMACSWRLPLGRNAQIEAAFFGSEGGAALRNLNGSFYDFVAERYQGTACEQLAAPPDAWGGRAAADWARRLAAGERYSAEAERFVEVAAVLDRIYGRAA